MSADTKNIYDEYIKPLSRTQRVVLLNILEAELNSAENRGRRNIIDLHGLGKEIWQGTTRVIM